MSASTRPSSTSIRCSDRRHNRVIPLMPRPAPAGPRRPAARTDRETPQAGLRAQRRQALAAGPHRRAADLPARLSATTCTAASPCADWSATSERTFSSSVSPVPTSACKKCSMTSPAAGFERHRYRWMHCRSATATVMGSWVERDEPGQRTLFFTKVRGRWASGKWFNCLAFHGYNIKRNFGHGNKGLANLLEPVRLCATRGPGLCLPAVAAMPPAGRHAAARSCATSPSGLSPTIVLFAVPTPARPRPHCHVWAIGSQRECASPGLPAPLGRCGVARSPRLASQPPQRTALLGGSAIHWPERPKSELLLAGLFLLSVVTYLDRVCINSAGPDMQRDQELSNTQWGMVLSAFLAAY